MVMERSDERIIQLQRDTMEFIILARSYGPETAASQEFIDSVQQLVQGIQQCGHRITNELKDIKTALQKQ
jgi:hypothetical protein